MSTYDDLLACVIAAPDDDGPRLCFADYLDEHGSPERAEMIRGQIQRIISPHIFPPGCPAQYQMVDSPLPLSRNASEELPNLRVVSVHLADGIPGISLTVHRGFISAVRGTLADLRRHLPELVKREPVVRVEVTDYESGEIEDVYSRVLRGRVFASSGSMNFILPRLPDDILVAISDAILAEARAGTYRETESDYFKHRPRLELCEVVPD